MKDKQKLTELVIKAQAGDQDALNDLIGACYEDLYYFAYQTVKDPDTASDIIQDSCIKIITNLDKLQSPDAFHVWARNITYHQCAQHFRQVKEVQPLETEDGESVLDSLPDESEGSLPEQVVEDKEFQKTMQDMLDSLPTEQRSAMMLYYYEKLSVKQIAEVFETSEGTIKSRLNYGRKAMKGKVEEYEKKNGVRLHSSLLPLLLLWMFRGTKESLPKTTMPVLFSASSAAATGAAGTATASTGLVAKIVAGAVAAVIAVGAVIGGVAILGRNKTPSSDNNSHKHAYVSQAYDENGHWEICECGETSEAASHHFNGRYCDVCSYAKPSEGLAFAEVSGGYAVVGIGDCTDTDISIPSTHEGKPVVSIQPKWEYTDGSRRERHENTRGSFEGNTQITSVFVPGSVAYLGTDTFAGCTALSKVVLSEGVQELGEWIFDGCTALTEIVMPSSITKVKHSFYGSCFTKAVISYGTTDISDWFSECETLTTVNIPDTVTKMEGTFFNCTSLRDIYFQGSMAAWEATYKDETEYDSITGEITQYAWDYGTGDYVVHCTDGDIYKNAA
jgi:RNA polymerase sigma factor (sigma-70 family)